MEKSGSYERKTRGFLRLFDKRARRVRWAIAAHLGQGPAWEVLAEARDELASLVPELPYVGTMLTNCFYVELIGAAMSLALFRALRRRGMTVEDAGRVLYDVFRAFYLGYSPFVRRVVGWLHFHPIVRFALRRYAARSQKRRHAGDWVFELVDGDGRAFDYGLDFTDCAILKFFRAQGAQEFAEILCSIDYPMSEAFDSGLVRPGAMSEGAARCDFRFKKGRAVATGWPPKCLANGQGALTRVGQPASVWTRPSGGGNGAISTLSDGP